MIHSYFLRALSLLVLLTMAPPANADWINLTGSETAANIAEIYVMDDHVRLVLEVYVGDLEVFEDLVPDDWLNDKPGGRPDEATRIRRFAEERFQFITDAGEKLPAEVVLVEARERVDRQSPFAGMINPYTRQRVPEAPADKRVLYAEIIYPFAGKPELDHEIRIDDVNIFDPVQVSEVYNGIFGTEDIGKSTLGQTPLKGHLTAFKPCLDTAARAGLLSAMTTAGGFSDTATGAATDPSGFFGGAFGWL